MNIAKIGKELYENGDLDVVGVNYKYNSLYIEQGPGEFVFDKSDTALLHGEYRVRIGAVEQREEDIYEVWLVDMDDW